MRVNINSINNWIHKTPTVPLCTVSGINFDVYVSFLMFSVFVILFNQFDFFTLVTLGFGWFHSLTTSLVYYQTVKACGGSINTVTLATLGGISPTAMRDKPLALQLIAAVSGSILHFIYFIVAFILGGYHLEFALGEIHPSSKYSFFQALSVWYACLMMWQMLMNFCLPLFPLTGLEILRFAIGGFASQRTFLWICLIISLPISFLFLWYGTMQGPNLFQLWLAFWAFPQIVQIIFALHSGINDVHIITREIKN